MERLCLTFFSDFGIILLFIGGKHTLRYGSRIRWRVGFPQSYPAFVMPPAALLHLCENEFVISERMDLPMEKNSNRLITGKIAPALLSFALPFMAASFLQSVYGAVDLFVVGQYASSSAVSAVSIGSQLMMTVTALVQGISMGGTVQIGHKIGEEDGPGTARAVGNLAFLFAVIAVVMTPVMLLCTNGMVSLMQTPAEAVADARRYVFICCVGLPFIVGYNAVSSIFRGIGDSKTPVYFISIACVVNIALDFLLTGYFKMGAAGAAVATTAAQGVSFLCALFYMVKKGFAFPFHKTDFIPQAKMVKAILSVGIPLAMQDVLVHFSFLAISAIINTLGVIASAAVGVVEKLMGFAFLMPSAFGSAVATMVAQNIGAGKRDRASASMRWGILFSLICGTLVVLVSELAPEVLITIFSKDSAVIAAGAEYIRTYALDCLLVSFVFNINAYLNGTGKSVVCFAHSMVATFLVRIPVTWLMSKITAGSLLAMGLAAPAASVASIVICTVYFAWAKGQAKKQNA